MSTHRDPIASPRDALRAVWRHRVKATLTFVVLFGAAVAAAFCWPRNYGSEAKLFVRLGRESVSLDPTATTGQMIALSETRESEINSILELLRSRTVMERVADRLTPAAILNRELATASLTREAAVEKLYRVIDVDARRNSNVITVHAEARTPELARDIAQRFIDSYLDEHVRAHRTQGSRPFFQQQAVQAERRLADAREAVRKAKDQAGLVSLEGQRQALQTQLASIDTQIHTTQASRAAGEVQTAALAARVQQLPERVKDDSVSGMPNVAGDGIKQKYFELQVRERELTSKMTAEHPLLAGVREQMEQLQKIVDALPEERTQHTMRINRLREGLEAKLHGEQAALESLGRQLEVLQGQRTETLNQLRQLNSQEVRLLRLERDVQVAEVEANTYSEKLEQARINEALDAQRISNVNVVQPPSLVLKASGPNKALLLMVGLLLAISGALGVVFLAELLPSPPPAARRLPKRSPPAVEPGHAPHARTRETVLASSDEARAKAIPATR